MDHCELEAVLDCIDTEKLATELSPSATRRGPKGYGRRSVVKSLIAMRWLGIPSVSALRRALANNPALRRVCEMEAVEALPSVDTIRRVRRQLSKRAEALRERIGETITELKEYLPELGEEVAVDSTGIPSHSNGNREPSSDPEASWRYCRKAGVKGGFEWVYGYGYQTVVDANYGLPLDVKVTTGARNDSPEFIPTMEEFESLNLDTRVVIADRGYDSKDNNKWLHERDIAPVIHIRVWGDDETHRRDWSSTDFSANGVPLCECGIEREFLRTDDRGFHVYAANPKGCPNPILGRKVPLPGEFGLCGREVAIDPERDIRLFGGIIRRGSPEWDAAYAKRIRVEQKFGHWKQSDRIKDHYLRGIANIEWLALTQTLVDLASELARLRAVAETEPTRLPTPLPVAA